MRISPFIAAAAASLLAGCVQVDTPDAPGNASDEVTLVLNINDVAGSSSSRYDAESLPGAELPATELEKINTLRVLIVRPNGQVEINRLIVPVDGMIHQSDLYYRVKSNEYKYVYLIGNEESITYDFSGLLSVAPGALLNPENPEFASDVVNLKVSGISPDKPVPMSAVYKVSALVSDATYEGGDLYSIRYNLTMLRSLVKCTFNLYNLRSVDFTVSRIALSNTGADSYYLFPHVGLDASPGKVVHYITAAGSTVTESGTGRAPVYLGGSNASEDISYTEHFKHNYAASAVGTGDYAFLSQPIVVSPSATPRKLTYYHYESNQPGMSAAPYYLSIDFEGTTYNYRLDNLTSLPRNTHVVVNIRFNNSDKVLEVEVEPYEQVTLRPGFG